MLTQYAISRLGALVVWELAKSPLILKSNRRGLSFILVSKRVHVHRNTQIGISIVDLLPLDQLIRLKAAEPFARIEFGTVM
jgi:hypothetical protein